MLVSSDLLTDKNYPALSRGKGDAFMIIGATLYGFSTSHSKRHNFCIDDGHISQCHRRVLREEIAAL